MNNDNNNEESLTDIVSIKATMQAIQAEFDRISEELQRVAAALKLLEEQERQQKQRKDEEEQGENDA